MFPMLALICGRGKGATVKNMTIIQVWSVPMATRRSSRFPDISPSMLSCRLFLLMLLYSTMAVEKKTRAMLKPWGRTNALRNTQIVCISTHSAGAGGRCCGTGCPQTCSHLCPISSPRLHRGSEETHGYRSVEGERGTTHTETYLRSLQTKQQFAKLITSLVIRESFEMLS